MKDTKTVPGNTLKFSAVLEELSGSSGMVIMWKNRVV